jgi:hypothetical protein
MTQFAQPAKGWILTAESQCNINGLMQGDNRALCGLRRLILPDEGQFILLHRDDGREACQEFRPGA